MNRCSRTGGIPGSTAFGVGPMSLPVLDPSISIGGVSRSLQVIPRRDAERAAQQHRPYGLPHPQWHIVSDVPSAAGAGHSMSAAHGSRNAHSTTRTVR